MNKSELWDDQFTWYFPSETRRICLYGSEYDIGYLSNLPPGMVWHTIILMWDAMHEFRLLSASTDKLSPALPCRLWLCNTPTVPLQKGKTTPMSVLDMTLNNLIVRFQRCCGFVECGAPLHCYCSQVHSARRGSTW